MASKYLSFFYVVLINLVLMIAAAKEIKVGDAQGWQQPDFNHTYLYSLWASRIKFYVGDSLRQFLYPSIVAAFLGRKTNVPFLIFLQVLNTKTIQFWWWTNGLIITAIRATQSVCSKKKSP